MISYFCGVRPGKKELLKLRWDAIDWSAETILIKSAKKGGIEQREIHLHDIFLECLNCWYESDIQFDPMPSHIIRWRGEPIQKLRRSWQNAKRRAGITRRLRPYDLRHALASELLRHGADLKSVSEILGHTRPDTTAKIYQHVNTKQKKDAIERLPW